MALKECSMSKRAYKTFSKEFKVEVVQLAAESDKPERIGDRPRFQSDLTGLPGFPGVTRRCSMREISVLKPSLPRA